jgi:hypothetical protein
VATPVPSALEAARPPGALAPAEKPVSRSANLVQARSKKPSGRGMLWRQTATLSHFLRHMPQALRLPAGEKCHVARPEPADLAFFVGDEDFAGDDVQRFIQRVMPVEAAGGARPGIHRSGAVRASRQTR